MAFVELDGLRIHYKLDGAANLPMLVFSNSLGVNLAMWKLQAQALSSHFRVLRYDTRGHGRSSVPLGPYTIAELGEDVLHLLDALVIEQASFCGLSLGGVTGQWLSIYAPNRIQKLILANTAAKIGNEEAWNTRIAIASQEGLSSIIPATLERWFTPAFRAAQPQIVANTSAMLHATDPQGYAACCAAIRDADFRSNIRTIGTPTLVIAGTHDPVTSPDDGRFLAENIPAAEYVELPTAHLSNTEGAEGFNVAVLKFLQLQPSD